MAIWLRYRDLEGRGIVRSWAQLKRLQILYGFPTGRMLTPNCRAWTDKEIDNWIASRPVENTRPLQGTARARHARRARQTAPEKIT